MSKKRHFFLKSFVVMLFMALLFMILVMVIVCKLGVNEFGGTYEKCNFSQSDIQALEDIYQVDFPDGTEFGDLCANINTWRDTRISLHLTVTLPQETKNEFIENWIPKDTYYNSLTPELQQEQISKAEMRGNFIMSLSTREDYENFEKCYEFVKPELGSGKMMKVIICGMIIFVIILGIVFTIYFIKYACD